MSREWLAAYTGILGKPKYRRFSIEARATLLQVWLLAGGQIPEATWRSREDLADVLELDGYPPGTIDELLERRWLDVDESGRVLVHDWDDHQYAASHAIASAWEADRKRKWRREKKARPSGEADPLSPAPLSPDITGTQQDITEQESGTRPDVSGTRNGRTPTPDPPMKGLRSTRTVEEYAEFRRSLEAAG